MAIKEVVLSDLTTAGYLPFLRGWMRPPSESTPDWVRFTNKNQ